jgi:hypothetical protein
MYLLHSTKRFHLVNSDRKEQGAMAQINMIIFATLGIDMTVFPVRPRSVSK